MSGHNHPHNHLPDDFEGVYASGVQWSGNPNDTLVREAGALTPATALDVGCGEGADAVWLAENGWNVTAIDPSATAIERTRALAAEHDVAVEAICGDAAALVGRSFDLVTCSYVPFTDGAAVAQLEALVAPGGTLLFVHHDLDPSESRGILSPRDVAELLTELSVVELKSAKRHVTSGAGAHHTDDVVLVAAAAAQR